MTMKKIFSAVSAAAILSAALSVSAVSVSAEASEPAAIAQAMLSGQMGTYSQWEVSDAEANGSTVANINGNAKYEATWDITGDGTDSIQFLILQIKGIDNEFCSYSYPDLGVTIDEIYIDNIPYTFTDNADAYTLAWSEGSNHVRVFLTDTWSINGSGNLGIAAPANGITTQVKVVFTVSGLYNDGTSADGGMTIQETTTQITTSSSLTTTTTTSLETENIYGDANDDKSISIADSILILQYIVDSSKYELSEQGLKNADVYLRGDGINAQDALSIQKYKANQINSLPESYMS